MSVGVAFSPPTPSVSLSLCSTYYVAVMMDPWTETASAAAIFTRSTKCPHLSSDPLLRRFARSSYDRDNKEQEAFPHTTTTSSSTTILLHNHHSRPGIALSLSPVANCLLNGRGAREDKNQRSFLLRLGISRLLLKREAGLGERQMLLKSNFCTNLGSDLNRVKFNSIALIRLVPGEKILAFFSNGFTFFPSCSTCVESSKQRPIENA